MSVEDFPQDLDQRNHHVLRGLEPNGRNGAQAPATGALVSPGAPLGQASAGPVEGGGYAPGGQGRLAALPQAPEAFGVFEHLSAADLDELVKQAALARLRARGFALSEGRFFERAKVERWADGSVRVRVAE